MLPKTIFILTAFSFVFFGGCKKKEQGAETLPADSNPNLIQLSATQMKQITVDTARYEEEKTDLSLSGKVDFNKDQVIQMFSFVSGNVVKVNVSLGDHVKKGDILAVLRSADVGNYQSQFDQATGQMAAAKRNLDVAQQLYDTKVYSELELLNAKVAYQAAADNYKQIQTFLKTYGVNDSDKIPEYKIIAPIDGYIVSKSINEGMNLRSDNSASSFTISSLNTVWVEANVYENDIPSVAVNDSVEVNPVAYPEGHLKGIISKLSNVLDSSASTLQARIVLDNSEGLLKPGMFTSIKVHLDKHKRSIAVPKEAIVFYDNDFYVMVSKGNMKFEKRQVTIDGNNDKEAYINTGVQAGEIVVGKGSLYVLGQ